MADMDCWIGEELHKIGLEDQAIVDYVCQIVSSDELSSDDRLEAITTFLKEASVDRQIELGVGNPI